MLDVAELLHDHQAIDAGARGVAHTVDVVAGQIDQHDVLGAVLLALLQLLGELVVFLRGFAARNGAGDGVRDNSVVFVGFDEEFGGGADEMEVGAGDVEEIGGGVEGAEVRVEVEGVEGCGSGKAVGRNGLEDVAFPDVLFEGADVGFVSGRADVGGEAWAGDVGGLAAVGGNGLLRGKRDAGGLEG